VSYGFSQLQFIDITTSYRINRLCLYCPIALYFPVYSFQQRILDAILPRDFNQQSISIADWVLVPYLFLRVSLKQVFHS